jgi:hypothetical protein
MLIHNKNKKSQCLDNFTSYGINLILFSLWASAFSFFLKNAFFNLSIFIMSILKCVFLYRVSGKFCRSGAETFAGLDRQNLPVWAGNPHLIPVS